MKNRQAGFTLAEIAIVLVIIGLLMGSVLKGRELINNAKVKNLANDFNQIAAAFYGYQDRYRRFPGDDNDAVSRWGSTTANGDGDGAIAGDFYTNSDTSESRRFWQHLRLAGFIVGDTASSAQPGNAVGGIIGVQTSAGPKTAREIVGTVLCSTNLPGKIAIAIDHMLDDGKSASGSVRGYAQTGPLVATAPGSNSPVNAASATSYTEDETTLYTVCRAI